LLWQGYVVGCSLWCCRFSQCLKFWSPRWLCLGQYSIVSNKMWEASNEPAQPGSPALEYATVWIAALSAFLGETTYCWYSLVLPHVMKAWKNTEITSSLIPVFLDRSSKVQPRPR
jgi:hypothetical protein